MDPQAALIELLEALDEASAEGTALALEDRLALVEKLRNLAGWLEKGGFPPNLDEALDTLGYHDLT